MSLLSTRLADGRSTVTRWGIAYRFRPGNGRRYLLHVTRFIRTFMNINKAGDPLATG